MVTSPLSRNNTTTTGLHFRRFNIWSLEFWEGQILSPFLTHKKTEAHADYQTCPAANLTSPPARPLASHTRHAPSCSAPHPNLLLQSSPSQETAPQLFQLLRPKTVMSSLTPLFLSLHVIQRSVNHVSPTGDASRIQPLLIPSTAAITMSHPGYW